MRPKLIFTGFVLLFTSLSVICFSQNKTKVLEKSQKKQPEWVNSLVQNYVITTASGTSIDECQQKALAKVKEQIISSVAENIQTSSTYFRKENIKDNASNFEEEMATATKTRAADIPFLKGISISQVEAFYWEKVRENNTEKYYYHIKYPFTKIQLQQLIREFEAADRELTKQLDDILTKLETTNIIEELSSHIKELEALAQGFIDVDKRKDKANVGIAKGKQMLKDVAIETVNATLGEIRVSVCIGDKVFITSRKPFVKSNCAKITEIKNNKSEWIIKYSYDECYEDPDNKISVSFKNPYGGCNSDFYFNINADKVDIFVNNDIVFSGGNDNGTEITSSNLSVSITSKYESPFIIEKIILNFGNESPVIIDNINLEFTGKGKHDLNLTVDQALNKEIFSAKKYSSIKGTIQYKSKKSGEKSIYKMYNQPISTTW